MNFEVQYSPAYAIAFVQLDAGEKIQAEAGAMVSMSPSVKMDTGTRGGVLAGLKRSVLGGESFFINTFTAETPGEVSVAPALPGDIVALEVGPQTLYIQSGSFLAATDGVKVDTKWGGGKTFFSREGLFLLKCTGEGTVLVSSYGAIHMLTLEPGERHIVDTGHMVAFDESVSYDVGRAGGWKSTLLGGEGLVVHLTGPGRFFMQTRSPDSFLDWLVPKLPGKRE
ncbi:MAG: TIGR00266 family protein [Dehalococcoidia bacterium]